MFAQLPAKSNAGNWSPFNDTATLSAMKREINASLDRKLKDLVDERERFYFRHLNHGLDLIDENKVINWNAIHGIIVDVSCAQDDPANAKKLERAARELARVAPTYSHLGTGVLVCLIDETGTVPDAVRRPDFKLRQPENAERFEDQIAVWLVDLSLSVYRGLESADKEVRKAAKKELERSLGVE